MMELKRIIAVLAVIALFATGCMQTGTYSTNTTQDGMVQDTNGNSQQATSGSSEVEIRNFAYAPQTMTVNVGDTITWTNYDDVGHTVTSDTGDELASELLQNGQSYSHTFTAAGTYPYYCIPHPNMKATVIVQ